MGGGTGTGGEEITFGRGLRDAFTPVISLTERELSHLYYEQPEILAHFIQDAHDADNPELALVTTGILAAKMIVFRSLAATTKETPYVVFYEKSASALVDFLPLMLPGAEQIEQDVKKPQFGANPNIGLGFGLDKE